MAGVPLYHDELPLLNTELELRSLLEQITGASADRVSQILAFELPTLKYFEIFDRWFDHIGDERARSCPELRARTRQLIGKLQDERISMAVVGPRRWDPLPDMLVALRGVAANPYDENAVVEVQLWRQDILRARKALFLSMRHVIPDVEEFPYRKKQRTNQSIRGTSSSSSHLSQEKLHTELSERVGCQETLQPTRRSKRALSSFKLGESSLSRKRIPLGEFFQADVPEWTEPPANREVFDDSKWLGTQIWPIQCENREIHENIVGKGRPDSCSCNSPGSGDCIRVHISSSRMHLKSELGQAFFSSGFDRMGEEVSESWTNEEEMIFDILVKRNPPSQCMSFWKPALNYFKSKRSQDIASYYFNVVVLRRMSKQTRSAYRTADSDDDEDSGKAFHSTYAQYSQSFYYQRQASLAYTLPGMCRTITGNMVGPS